MADERRIWVTEVHNFGGFFGGDTVTLAAMPWPSGDEETLTIDDRALTNVPRRHMISPEMLFALDMAGDRIDRATLLGARAYEVLHQAIDLTPPSALDAPQIRAYRCPHCDLWVAGQPSGDDRTLCAICGQDIG